MILIPIDLFFLFFLFIVIGVMVILMYKNQLNFFLSFILGLSIAGLVIFWGIVRTGFSDLPQWIQAGATICLLIITAMSTYATMITAQANLELADATKKQLTLIEKERKSKIIKEISRNIFQTILWQNRNEMDSLGAGYIIVSYSRYKLHEREDKWPYFDAPNEILKKQSYTPDLILQNKLHEIKALGNRYDQYKVKMNNLLDGIFQKKLQTISSFQDYCKELLDSDKSFNIQYDIDNILGLTIADTIDSKYSRHTGYDFHIKNRELLFSKVKELGFSDEIEEFKLLKEEFGELQSGFESVLRELFEEWKQEYYLTDNDIENPAFKNFV